MKYNYVPGEDRGEIALYALSTCGWCAKTKKFLNNLGVAYNFVDVDMLDEDEREAAIQEIRSWNPAGSFPTLVFDDRSCVVGYDERKILEELGK